MKTEKYTEREKRLPKTGRQIIGCIEHDSIIVYQAFNPNIAKYAIEHQRFGGPHYSFNRMSWIKPGFLWMMHRAGWAAKENQQHILAIRLPLMQLKKVLTQAPISSYDKELFVTQDEWKMELGRTEVRLQWDPDHDPFGNKQDRKAIQLGMKGETLEKFCTEWITGIEDITGFVNEEYEKLTTKGIHELLVPFEQVLVLNDSFVEKRIGMKEESSI